MYACRILRVEISRRSQIAPNSPQFIKVGTQESKSAVNVSLRIESNRILGPHLDYESLQEARPRTLLIVTAAPVSFFLTLLIDQHLNLRGLRYDTLSVVNQFRILHDLRKQRGLISNRLSELNERAFEP